MPGVWRILVSLALVALMGWVLWNIIGAQEVLGYSLRHILFALIALVAVIAAPFFAGADETGRRLIIARVLLFVVALAAAGVASTKPSDILSMVAWAFSLAAAGLFPALVMGIWWKRTNGWGAAAGMIVGFGLCLYYLVGTRYFASSFYETWGFLSNANDAAIAKYNELKTAWQSAAPDAQAAAWTAFDKHAQTMANWWGLRNISAALFALPLGFFVMWLVSLMTRAPSQELRDMIDNVRRPKGATVLEEKTA
jgi:cation/acetate symporter